MKITRIHRIRSLVISSDSSDQLRQSLRWRPLRVGLAVLVFMASALLSLVSLSPIALAGTKAPSWHRVSLPLGQGELLQVIKCASSGECLIGGESAKGAVILSSRNGGADWRSITLPLGHGSLVSAISCPIKTRCLAGGSGARGAVLLDSTDGGSSWHQVTLLSGDGLQGNNFSIISTITCPTTTTCLAGGSGARGAVILSSGNGAADWHSITLPLGHGSFVSSITCPTRTRCLAGVDGAKGAVLLDSTDGGSSWHQVTLPSGDGLHGTNFALINAISCPIKTRCLAGGSGARGAVLLDSTDGGSSWHQVTLPLGLGLHGRVKSGLAGISTIACPSNHECLVGGAGAKGAILLNSTDGANNWQPITLGLKADKLGLIRDISCPATTTCLAVGQGHKGPVLISSSAQTGSSSVSVIVVLAAVVVLLLVVGSVALSRRTRHAH